MDIKQLTILFSNRIDFQDVPLFRGGVIHMIKREGGEINMLFHNHLDNKYRWSYPLIQYKVINGNAALVCIGEGIDAITDFFSTGNRSWMLHGKENRLNIQDIRINKISLDAIQEALPYRVQHWIPLNSVNYGKYQGIESLAERIGFLENILTANILSMAKGIGMRMEQRISCSITDLSSPELIERKYVKMMTFNACFKANIVLPNYIGIGKHASLGHGMITTPLII